MQKITFKSTFNNDFSCALSSSLQKGKHVFKVRKLFANKRFVYHFIYAVFTSLKLILCMHLNVHMQLLGGLATNFLLYQIQH